MTIHSRNKAVKHLLEFFLSSSISAVAIFPDDKTYTYNKDIRKLSSEKDQERVFSLFSAL